MKTEPMITFPQEEIGPEMRGADVLVRCMEREGVEVIFAYPGGASMEMHQALTRPTSIRTILPRFEQGGGFMAHGYARATGKAGVCMATSGPGATNLLTCIADAFMDSVPLIAITGQVRQEFIGKAAFQETDVFGMTLPVVKHSYLVLHAEDLPRIVKEAFHIAQSGRPGPVLIDIPKDVQQALVKPRFTNHLDLPGYPDPPVASDEEIRDALSLLQRAKRPVFYTGGGIMTGGAQDELLAIAEMTGFPVATTLMGLGSFPESHPLSLRWFGMHGTVYGNWAVDQCDLLITLGARFDDRITGRVDAFASDATIIHVDIDKSEHQKNKQVDLPIQSDVKYFLRRAVELGRQESFSKPDITDWWERIRAWMQQYPFAYEESNHILAQEAIAVLYEETGGEAIITTGVGQHQMWAAQFYKFHQPKSYLSSLGLGAMGFGLPAALGAKVAFPDRTVIDVDGDGSFLMNIQELATAVIENIHAKVLLINNQHLGMVVQWEDRLYDGVRAQTILGDPDNIGSPDNLDGLYPDFVKMSESFGVKARQIISRDDLREGIREMLAHEGPYVLDVVIPYTEHVMPMVPAGSTAKEILIK